MKNKDKKIVDAMNEFSVDNDFKENAIINGDIKKVGNLISVSYYNYGEKYVYPEFSLEDWNFVLEHKRKLEKAGYKDQKIDDFIKNKYFENDQDQYLKFKNWSTQKMSNKKYASKIEKEATYGMGISPNSRYEPQIYGLPGSSFYDDDPSIQKAREIKEEQSKGKKSPEKAIYRNIMGIMRVLQREDMDFDTYSSAMSALVSLMDTFKKKFSNRTLSDATARTAKRFDKLGLTKYAGELTKISQQIEEADQAPQAQQAAPEQQAAQPQAEQEAAPAQQETAEQDAKAEALKQMSESEPIDLRTIETEGPEDGEYDKIISDNISIDDAASKLDEVASMLADRRVIRMLAEFDIMLDSIGIASMFPELAESQSKLIDAFSYALTRVSKMMGQISNARTLIDASDSIPGTDNVKINEESQAQPEVQTGDQVGTETE